MKKDVLVEHLHKEQIQTLKILFSLWYTHEAPKQREFDLYFEYLNKSQFTGQLEVNRYYS
jgi:hypothetical protein